MDTKECEFATIKLTFELRQCLGLLAHERRNFKFIKRECLIKKLKKLSIHLPQLQECKSEIVCLSVESSERSDHLKIILAEEQIEKEICLRQSSKSGSAVLLNIENDGEETEETEPGEAIDQTTGENIAKTQGWTCLGSEHEIILSHAPKQRPLQIIEAEVFRGAKTSSAPLADNKIAKGNSASFPAIKENMNFTERKAMDFCVQVGESKSVEAQTIINFPANVWVQWSPQSRDFDAEYTEEQKEGLKNWVQTKTEHLLDFVHHNLILENHTDDFQGLTLSDELKIPNGLNSSAEYHLTKIISNRSECQGVAIAHAWHPKSKEIIAISYGDFHNYAAVEEIGVCDKLSDFNKKCSNLFVEKVVLWNCALGEATCQLSSSFRVDCISFCPEEEDKLLGGCSNGEIILWDLAANFHTGTTVNRHIDHSISKKSSSESREAIIGLHWLNSSSDKIKSLLTVSSGGSIIIWRMVNNDLLETGVKFAVLSKNIYLVTKSLLIRRMKSNISTTEPHIFDIILGSHDGGISLFKIDTLAKPASEIEEEDTPKPLAKVTPISELDASKAPKIHDGPVTDLKQSPLEKNIFLSIGGQIFAIFCTLNKKLDHPLVLKRGSTNLSSGCWSLYTKNIFYIFTNNGRLQVWNMQNCKSSLEEQICLSPGYLKDLSYPEKTYQNGIIPITDDRGSILLCKIPSKHQKESPKSENTIKREIARTSKANVVPLQPLASSSKVKAEVKEGKRAKRREEDLLASRVEELVKQERGEILVLRAGRLHKDKATRLEAARRLTLLEELPQHLLALKRVDTKRLLEVELPMIDLQKKQLRRTILRERRIEADSDFLR